MDICVANCMDGDIINRRARIMEPDDVGCGKWFDLNALSKNVYARTRKMIENDTAHHQMGDL